MAYPDVSRSYKLYTDASNYAIGGILTQENESGEHVIQYLSHKLTAGQQKWPVIEKEAYAIVYAIRKLRPYLYGAKFTVYTDHKPLKSLFTAEMNNTRIQRWAILINEYGCDIQHTSGKSNARADYLSRAHLRPMPEPQVNVLDSDKQGTFTLTNTGPEETVSLEVPDFKNIVQSQQNYTHLSNIRAALKGDVPCKYSEEYVMEGDTLYHLADPVRLDHEPRMQLAIPAALVETILNNYHDGNGHFGIDKTYQTIRARYFWKNMYKDTVNYVLKCTVCSTRKLKKKRIEMQNMPIPEYPFQTVGIDTCGPYLESFSGNRYIVTIVDHFSGWPEAYPCQDKSAETIAKLLLEEFIPRFSCPSTILSDNGSEYVNSIIACLSKELNIHRMTCSPHHPQGNGKTERFHRVLNDILEKSPDSRSAKLKFVYHPCLIGLKNKGQ